MSDTASCVSTAVSNTGFEAVFWRRLWDCVLVQVLAVPNTALDVSDTRVSDKALGVVFILKSIRKAYPSAISPFFKNGEIAEG